MTYRKPGVYVTEKINPAFATLTGGNRVVGLVGNSFRKTRILDQAVVRGATMTDVLTTGTIVAIEGVGDAPGYYNYSGTAYGISIAGTGITWTGYTTPPTLGKTYYVTYTIAKTDADYNIHTLYSMDQVRAEYGYEKESGTINELSLMAYLAFQNGASIVKCAQIDLRTAVDPDNPTAAELYAAYYAAGSPDTGGIAKFKEVDVDVLVCGAADKTAYPTIKGYLKSHVSTMSSSVERKERIGVVTSDATNSTASQIVTQAGTMNSDRIVMVVPSAFLITLKDYITKTSVQSTVAGQYGAAALAGKICSPAYDVSESMTRKLLSGFDELGATFLESEMDAMGAAGVSVLVGPSPNVMVRHGLTTNPLNANTSEISVVMTKDYVVKQLRSTLDAAYIGQRILPGTTDSIKLTTKTMLTDMIQEQIINDFRNISATQSTSDPRNVSLIFEIEAIYPLIWLDVTYNLYLA